MQVDRAEQRAVSFDRRHDQYAWRGAGRFAPLALGTFLIGSLVAPLEASAADECGVAIAPYFVTCTGPSNPYANGISYSTSAAEFALTLDGTVVVNRAVGFNNVGIGLDSTGSDGLTLNFDDGVSITTQGLQSDGARLRMDGDGDINIVSSADISVDRDAAQTPWPTSDPTAALLGWIKSPTKTATGTINITQKQGSRLTLAGSEELVGLYGIQDGLGNVEISSFGEIYGTSIGDIFGAHAYINNIASTGNISLYQGESAVFDITGIFSAGLYALHDGEGDASTEASGRITIVGHDSDGILSYSTSATSEGQAVSVLTKSAVVTMTGETTTAARTIHSGLGASTVEVHGTAKVTGDDSAAAKLTQNNAANVASQSVIVAGNASITTNGSESNGVAADTDGENLLSLDIKDQATVKSSGLKSNGIDAEAQNALGEIELTIASGTKVTADGKEGVGARLDAGGAVTANNDGQIAGSGEYGIGIFAKSVNADATITLGSSASVIGGWQAGLTLGGGATLPSAGIVFDTGLSGILYNYGRIGAASDRAIADQAANAGEVTITNSGNITGFLDFSGTGTHHFTNANGGQFNIRHFADTDGDGVRDTKRVAISDFAASGGTFDNSADAIVRLAPVSGNSVTDDTSYYVPTTGVGSTALDASFYDLSRSGVVQGQMVNISTFANAGIIDLRGTATGNTLIITSNAAAGVAAGTGVFRSDGGSLLLNTYFNQGIAAGGNTGSYSDVLVVDSTQLGTASTKITIDRREGPGAVTPGNGILLVEVRNKAASAADVFALNGDFVTNGQQRVIHGAQSYGLFHNGVLADAADGNWYLRNLGLSPTVPVYEQYPNVLTQLIALPSLQQRIGNRQWTLPAAPRAPQTVFCKDAAQNYQCAITDEQADYYRTDPTGNRTEGGGLWGTIEADYGHYASVSATSSQYSNTLWKLRAGIDSALLQNSNGTLIAGVALNYGRGSAHITSATGSGDIASAAYGLGGSLTWYGATGFYADGQAQLTGLHSQLSSATTGRTLNDGNNGLGYALSLESGNRVSLNDNWALTPQAQLTFSNVGFDSFSDKYGAEVSLLQGQSLRGRLGLASEYQSSWKAEDGTSSRAKAYGIVNLEKDLLTGTRLNVSGQEFPTRDNGVWGSIGLGGTYNWNEDKYSLYGEVSAGTSLEHIGDSYALGGKLGLRAQW